MIIVSKSSSAKYKFLALLILSLIIYFAINSMLKPTGFQLYFDNKISTNLQNKISDVIYNYTPKQIGKIGARNLFLQLKSQFPSLQSLAIAYSASRNAKIIIQANEPVLLIGNHFLTKDNSIAQNSDFIFNKELPTIKITSDKELTNPKLPTWCDFALKNKIIENYNSTWKSENEIFLESKNKENLKIITDSNFDNLINKLNYAQKVYELKENNLKHKAKIDVRYNDFLVFAPEGKI